MRPFNIRPWLIMAAILFLFILYIQYVGKSYQRSRCFEIPLHELPASDCMKVFR